VKPREREGEERVLALINSVFAGFYGWELELLGYGHV
jgi:hypothetical protein